LPGGLPKPPDTADPVGETELPETAGFRLRHWRGGFRVRSGRNRIQAVFQISHPFFQPLQIRFNRRGKRIPLLRSRGSGIPQIRSGQPGGYFPRTVRESQWPLPFSPM
jgi:hypothetical protein